jgi:hypothetical protein
VLAGLGAGLLVVGELRQRAGQQRGERLLVDLPVVMALPVLVDPA